MHVEIHVCINAGWPALSNIAINFARVSEFLCYLVTDGCWFTQARFHQFEHARMWEGRKLHFWTRYVLLLNIAIVCSASSSSTFIYEIVFSVIKLWITYFLINRSSDDLPYSEERGALGDFVLFKNRSKFKPVIYAEVQIYFVITNIKNIFYISFVTSILLHLFSAIRKYYSKLLKILPSNKIHHNIQKWMWFFEKRKQWIPAFRRRRLSSMWNR